jgi:hypothetical protein
MSGDVIVDEVRRVRDELVKRYGGLDGWIEHLQAMDRDRARKAKQRTGKKPASNGRKSRNRPARSRRSRAIKES